jgi:acyl dehydratase
LIWWEDFKVGERAELGRHTFTEEEIVSFGRQYDPQPFHVDPEKAGKSVFGGLIASGWHTCAVGMRLMCEGYRRIVLESRASTTRKGIGLVKHRWEALNQHGELVLTMEGWGLFGRKD